MRRIEKEINSESLAKALLNIQNMLQNNYDLKDGERILSVQVKVKLDDEGYIVDEEMYSLMDEYNDVLKEIDFKEKH